MWKQEDQGFKTILGYKSVSKNKKRERKRKKCFAEPFIHRLSGRNHTAVTDVTKLAP